MGKVIEVDQNHLNELVHLAMKLYKNSSSLELKSEFQNSLSSPKVKFLLYIIDKKAVGFIHLSIREDYVEGAQYSPTGYIEGVYVEPEHRRKGISTKLFNSGKEWLIENGCKQIGSDMEIDNQDSYPFHISLGFREAGRIITFIKDLD
ncbi:aminoglycoside 6'-N-acetyltransferase [Ornithinibacillus halotolerans]|uniref:Aminoglycoside N(6')-acetyltransferase type 1 n=1 Tax=Ornithinibacillus halotolerans TaxID=1274357 RepID=A0A916S256_9BACI|nr:aminoglycoside 6'-N-acetyltransferase [Ornithinibacillus halotolerans]GGA78185.1 aminoglycoside N(6')-acetyltransferase type 1 [Ornithinibacillus halotolerans]